MSQSSFRSTAKALRAFALALPEVKEEFPWGERVAKVNKKIFVFFGRDEDLGTRLSMALKLPISGQDVLDHDFAKPTGYGLGRSGWVSLKFEGGGHPPTSVLESWIEESYRAVAPKRIAARLDGWGAGPKAVKKKPAKKKPPATRRGPAKKKTKRA